MTYKLTVGHVAPEFSLPDQQGRRHTLALYRGAWVLLYFYPKDDTPGCTKEACAMRDNFEDFQKRRIVILGVSADSVESHEKFADKYDLPFPMLSDPKKAMLKNYEAWRQKVFLGKKYMGIERMSYLINPQGRIAKVYPAVKPTAHAAEVLRDVEDYLGASGRPREFRPILAQPGVS